MATPNLINATTINGLTNMLLVTTTPTLLLSNAAASGKAQRINSLLVSNVNGTTAATVTFSILRSGVYYRIAYQMSVPAASTLDLVNKVLYLNEGDGLYISASVNSYLEAVVSYEEIS
jgi:uncharacterized membrane protein